MANKKNILITGGAGFIGFSLANYLVRKKYKVNIIDNLSRGKFDKEFKDLLKNKNVKFYKYNLNKKIKINLKNITHIFHLAGSVGVKNINKNAYGSFFNNIISLKNIIDTLQNKKKIKIILFSTSEVYSTIIQEKKVKFPIKESNNVLIKNDIIMRDAYFLSKIFNEKILQLSNLNYLILRPHNIYGPRMGFSHVIPELMQRMTNFKKKQGKKVPIFSPKHKRAFCYIEDAILQIVKLSFNTKLKNEIFNIGNMNEEISIIKLANKIKRLFSYKINLKNGEITQGSPYRRVPDMKKTLKFTKIKKFTNLNQGLLKTFKWYQNKI